MIRQLLNNFINNLDLLPMPQFPNLGQKLLYPLPIALTDKIHKKSQGNILVLNARLILNKLQYKDHQSHDDSYIHLVVQN